MKQVLLDNKFLGLASDQNAGVKGVKVPFFGKEVSIPKGAAYFYHKTKLPIAFSISEENLNLEFSG